ncbi:AtpZ/AtpI family protein [Aestuariispira ectoiniformans]|uniref:AtpZ/AtpI family protein n=1 Tax=Aestuariispira ectoiniformans TaxID=2775080 RepID=UPI00223C1C5E|nr:AtpZ/AtpI family protein [Aestuariispira ectoiniformans]
MTRPPPNHDKDEMQRAVQLRRKRRETWHKEGERSLWANLSMIGSFGWLIVVPTLLGVAAGRWLDRTFETGIFFSGALIFLGVTVGAYLVWKRINKA